MQTVIGIADKMNALSDEAGIAAFSWLSRCRRDGVA